MSPWAEGEAWGPRASRGGGVAGREMHYLYIGLFVELWLGPQVLEHVGAAGGREGSCSAGRGN